MQSIQTRVLFNTVTFLVVIMALHILSGCKSTVETQVTVNCPPNQSTPPDPDGPGIACGGNNRIEVPNDTSVASNAIAVGGGTIPAGAKCFNGGTSTTKSYHCKTNIPGKKCGFTTTTRCHDTYNTTTRLCDCRCM